MIRILRLCSWLTAIGVLIINTHLCLGRSMPDDQKDNPKVYGIDSDLDLGFDRTVVEKRHHDHDDTVDVESSKEFESVGDLPAEARVGEFITLHTTITTTSTSTLTTFRTCYTTLVANMGACSTGTITNNGRRRKRRSDEEVILEQPSAVDEQGNVVPLSQVIQASKVTHPTSDLSLELMEGRSDHEVSDQDVPLKALRYFALVGRSTSTVTIYNTALVGDPNTQTIRLTTPGCFPQSLFSSLDIGQC